ncbi:MAG TPA: hypothetical protein VII25_08380 [Candidatus Acidoferrum sp.]|jgi:hypothetical protein
MALQPFALLWSIFSAPDIEDFLWQAGNQVEGAGHALGFFAEDNFVAAPFDLDFLGTDAELFRQTDGLAVSGFEDSGGRWNASGKKEV